LAVDPRNAFGFRRKRHAIRFPDGLPLWRELPRIKLPQLAVLRLLPTSDATARAEYFVKRVRALHQMGLATLDADGIWRPTDRGHGTMRALAGYRTVHNTYSPDRWRKKRKPWGPPG
jgi:hypothetical protein